MKLKAIIDLLILGAVFWGVWALRYYGVANIGIYTMVAGVVMGFLLLKMHQHPLSSIGLKAYKKPTSTLITETLGAAAVIAIASIGGMALFPLLLGPLEASSAITTQPTTLGPFLLDIIVGVWIGAALGEEIFFRGLLLTRFQTLFSSFKYAPYFAVLCQAIWFGFGHASQGLTGIALTGLIGFGLGLYYIRRLDGNLLPLIIAHGLVNTLSLSINFFTSG